MNNEIIDKITENIISKVPSYFNTLQKIRFVYLELGKYLEKNTDFFLNDKLDKLSLSKETIDEIYFDNKINVSKRNNTTVKYQIICKSAALILKNIFDKLNIESVLIHTTGQVDDILHWFLVVKDNEKQYFLTLAADLPYIKNNFPTCHFASNINFFDALGNQSYVISEDINFKLNKVVKELDDGSFVTGYEIDHTVLTDEDFLKKLDESIGYGKLYESEDLLNDKAMKELFYVQMEENSKVFSIFRKCFKIEDDLFKKTFDITLEEVLNFKKELEDYVQEYLKKELKIDSDNAIKEYLVNFLKDEVNVDFNLSYQEIEKKYRNEIRKKNKKEKSDYITIIQSIVTLSDKFDNFIKLKTEYEQLEKNIQNYEYKDDDFTYLLQKQIIEKEEELDKALKSISIDKLKPILNTLAFCLIKKKLTISKNEYVPLEYIVNKFNLMFPLVFDCNFKNYQTVPYNSFSIQSYSEQIVIVKQMLKKIFSELSENNCKDMEDYDFHYSPVENRIQTYPLKDKQTGEYCIGFRFGAKAVENTVQYIYIPSSNTLRTRKPIVDLKKYWIVSQRFNKQLHIIENIEDLDMEYKKYA